MAKDKGNGKDLNYQHMELIFPSSMLEGLNQAAQQNQCSLHEEILIRLLLTLQHEEINTMVINHFAPEIEAALSGENQGVNPLIPLLLNPIRIRYTGDFPQSMLLMLEQAAQEKDLSLDIEIFMRLLATVIDNEAFELPTSHTVEELLQVICQQENKILH